MGQLRNIFEGGKNLLFQDLIHLGKFRNNIVRISIRFQTKKPTQGAIFPKSIYSCKYHSNFTRTFTGYRFLSFSKDFSSPVKVIVNLTAMPTKGVGQFEGQSISSVNRFSSAT